jgi:hypothetical protein
MAVDYIFTNFDESLAFLDEEKRMDQQMFTV